MDLEIADYERTVQNLHSAVAERESRIQGLLEELQCKEDQRAALQKLVGEYVTVVFLFYLPS